MLIDCGPDFRQQILPFPFKKIDGVLLTHIHFDHVAGIDDLRPFCTFGPIDIFANQATVDALKQTMPYCFAEHLYPGVPLLNLHPTYPRVPIQIGDIEILPIEVMHGKMPILGYRIGRFAYITDMKTIDAADEHALVGVEVLVVNALRKEQEHYSHQLLGDAVAFSQRLAAKRTLIIHSCHHIGLHEVVNRSLFDGVEMAFDGQVIEL